MAIAVLWTDRFPTGRSWSFRTWLILLVLATIAPLAGYGLYHALTDYVSQRTVLIESTTATARTLAGLASAELDRDVAALRVLAETPALRAGDFARFDPLARSFLARVMPGGSLSVFDPEGHTLATTRAPAPATREDPNTSALVFATAAPVVSDPRPVGGAAPLVPIDVPIPRAGRVAFDLSLAMPVARMQAIVARQRLPPGRAAAIVDSAGRFVALSPDPAGAIGTSAGAEILQFLVSGDRNGTAGIVVDGGTKAVAEMARAPLYGWSAGVAIPRWELVAPLRGLVEQMAAVGAAVLATSLLLALFIARRLARKVTALARFATALEGERGAPEGGGGATIPAYEPGLREADAVARVLRASVRRHQMAEELAEVAELRAARLIEAMPCGVSVIDERGRWIFVNRAICELLGRPAEILLGLTADSADLDIRRVDGTPIPWQEQPSMRALRGETVQEMEVTMLQGGAGGRVAVLLSAVPQRDRDGRTTGALAAMVDVTQRRAAQTSLDTLLLTLEARVETEVAAREAAQLQAAQAQKLRALGELAGGMAHDFNNVLQAVSGAVALIDRRADDPEKVRCFAATAAAASERGRAITGRLLTFARRGELRAVPIEAAGLLADMADILRHTLETATGAPMTIQTEMEASAGWLEADLAQLQTVLVNLGANARDAMPNGGVLTLRAVAETVGVATAHPAGPRPGAYVRIEVEDTGEGMDQDTLARAAEPFFTTKPPGKGTGLGLPMARGFVEQLGGALAVSSVPGRGTTVRLWLPAADAPA